MCVCVWESVYVDNRHPALYTRTQAPGIIAFQNRWRMHSEPAAQPPCSIPTCSTLVFFRSNLTILSTTAVSTRASSLVICFSSIFPMRCVGGHSVSEMIFKRYTYVLCFSLSDVHVLKIPSPMWPITQVKTEFAMINWRPNLHTGTFCPLIILGTQCPFW